MDFDPYVLLAVVSTLAMFWIVIRTTQAQYRDDMKRISEKMSREKADKKR